MCDPNFYIATPRLFISYFQADVDAHVESHFRLTNSPEVKEGNKAVATAIPDLEAARNNILRALEGQAETGYGRYIISLRPSSFTDSEPTSFSSIAPDLEYIGHISCKVRKHPQAPRVPDVGFALLRPYWKRGYATEAVSAVIKHFQEEWGQKEFLGYCNPLNEDSMSMFRRLGFENRGVRTVKGLLDDPTNNYGFEAQVWAIKGTNEDLSIYGL